MPNFSATYDDPLGVGNFLVLDHRLKFPIAKFAQWTRSVRMAQHAFGRKHDQRLAPVAQGLPSQQMEVLRGGGRLGHLNIIFGGKLQVALNATAGMFWSLAFIPMRK